MRNHEEYVSKLRGIHWGKFYRNRGVEKIDGTVFYMRIGTVCLFPATGFFVGRYNRKCVLIKMYPSTAEYYSKILHRMRTEGLRQEGFMTPRTDERIHMGEWLILNDNISYHERLTGFAPGDYVLE